MLKKVLKTIEYWPPICSTFHSILIFHNFHPVIIKYSISRGLPRFLILLLKGSRFVN